MWSKVAEILQQPASKRIGLAIVISAVLHIVFFGNIHLFMLPDVKQDMHLIEARIQMPQVEVPEASPPELEAQPEQTSEAEPIVEAAPEPVTEKIVEPIAKTDPEPDPEPAITQPQDVTAESTEPQNTEPENSQTSDIGLVINENAYQYVETEFDVSFKKDGNTYNGKANINYNLFNADNYQLKWLIQGTGLAALSPDLLQTSEGALTKTGLQPKQYTYQYGSKTDKSRTANFDWQTKKVTLTTKKDTKTEDLPEGAQDLLSFMYQFMYVAPLQNMQLPIVNGKKIRIYDYSFEGEELVNSALGEIKTIHISHSGSSEEDKTELWLAIDYQYVPVKIRKIDSDGSVVEMLATRITTNRPVINP